MGIRIEDVNSHYGEPRSSRGPEVLGIDASNMIHVPAYK